MPVFVSLFILGRAEQLCEKKFGIREANANTSDTADRKVNEQDEDETHKPVNVKQTRGCHIRVATAIDCFMGSECSNNDGLITFPTS